MLEREDYGGVVIKCLMCSRVIKKSEIITNNQETIPKQKPITKLQITNREPNTLDSPVKPENDREKYRRCHTPGFSRPDYIGAQNDTEERGALGTENCELLTEDYS